MSARASFISWGVGGDHTEGCLFTKGPLLLSMAVLSLSIFDYESHPNNVDPLPPFPAPFYFISISDITGIQFFHNLQVLEVPYNNISDISELALLPNLTSVDLRGNPITQINIDWLRLQLPNTTIYF